MRAKEHERPSGPTTRGRKVEGEEIVTSGG